MTEEQQVETEDERIRLSRPDPTGRRLTTVIGVCLDESGSMGDRDPDGGDKRLAAIDAYNEYLRGQQADTESDTCLMTLVTFNTYARVRQAVVPIANISPLSTLTYRPNGGTALFDAIAFCVAEAEKQPADRYVLVVLTDGEENSSRETSLQQLQQLIQTKTAGGNWTFTYLSADPNAFTQAAHYGIPAANAAVYTASVQGTSMGAQRLSAATRSYRHSTDSATMSFYALPEPPPPDPEEPPQ